MSDIDDLHAPQYQAPQDAAGAATDAVTQPATHPTTVPASPVSSFRRSRGLLIGGATVLALGIGAGGVGVGAALAGRQQGSTTQAVGPGSSQNDDGGLGDGGFGGSGGIGGRGNGGRQGTFGGPGTASVNATAATAAQKVGVVTIVSTLNYSDAEAAGTGIILTSTGEILTNNHVVQGSTSIKVTVESTGASYPAKVVGTDETDDVAVLQLVGSSGSDVTGLTTATLDTGTLSAGDAVISVGNAEGTGNLVAARGTVTALDQSITVANDISGADEHLSGLIETDADVVSGDSGGPLIDEQGEVAGMVTAASSGSRHVTGYAIPIDSALTIAKKIVNGEASSTIVIGLPAFLGVDLASAQSGSGVLISGVVAGSAAAGAGLAAGDTITAVDGVAATSADSLSSLIKAHAIGDRVTISYTDASGAAQQVAVTLTAGPAA
ncbi:MAG TPA: trypsin-like peptidase domain-containing protein [Pseudolysinimonas sp.]|nr:trypsin-like peptidase domain-containing protein [Pseudolysinimonas sp.]